jgi:deoxyribonuclease I
MGRSTVFTVFYLFVLFTYAHPPPDYYKFSPENSLRDNLFSSIEFRHVSLGYKTARQHLFGSLFLKGLSHDTYSLTTGYCQIEITNSDLAPTAPLAPQEIPDHQVVNTEHVWPQSKFSTQFPESLQKADLHILLPELSRVNSLRSNHPFGHVSRQPNSPCEGAALGKDSLGQTVFEPHDNIKGNVARALFYFSVRYKHPIDSRQEATLREWHRADPIDGDEEAHNEQVFALQKNRNPFIDTPDWVEQIQDF